MLYKEYEVCQKWNRTEVPPKYVKFKLETTRFRLRNASSRFQFPHHPLPCLHATPGRILPEFSAAPSSLSFWWLPRPKNDSPRWPLELWEKEKKITVSQVGWVESYCSTAMFIKGTRLNRAVTTGMRRILPWPYTGVAEKDGKIL